MWQDLFSYILKPKQHGNILCAETDKIILLPFIKPNSKDIELKKYRYSIFLLEILAIFHKFMLTFEWACCV